MVSKIKKFKEDEQVLPTEPSVDVLPAQAPQPENDVVVEDPTVEGADTEEQVDVEVPVVPEEGMVQATIPAGTEVFVNANELDTAVAMETGDAEVATDTAAAPVNPSDPTEPIVPATPSPVVEACEDVEIEDDKLEEEVSVGNAQGAAEVTIDQPEDKTFGEVPQESLAASDKGGVDLDSPIGPSVTALDVTPEEAEAIQQFLAQLRAQKAETPEACSDLGADMPAGTDLIGSAIVAAEEVPVEIGSAEYDALEDGFDDEYLEKCGGGLSDMEETISDKPVNGESPNSVSAPLDVSDPYDCNRTFVEDAEENPSEELASAADVSSEVEDILSKLESFLDGYDTENLQDIAKEEQAKAAAVSMIAGAAEQMDVLPDDEFDADDEDLDIESLDVEGDEDDFDLDAEDDVEDFDMVASLDDEVPAEEDDLPLDIESLVEPDDEMEESCEDGCPACEENIVYPATSTSLKARAEQIADENKVDGVDPFHDTDEEPNLVVKYESLSARRRKSMREHHRNLNRTRFAESLNRCGRLNENEDLNADEVIEGSWSSNRFIEKYNESKRLNFNELRDMLDSGLLG